MFTSRIRPVAQYCFIFMYGTIVTLGLLANVAVLVAFASKKVKQHSFHFIVKAVVVVVAVILRIIIAFLIFVTGTTGSARVNKFCPVVKFSRLNTKTAYFLFLEVFIVISWCFLKF